jgi:CSLREA domain-containing protein
MAFTSWLPWLKGSRGHKGRTQRGTYRTLIAPRKRFVPRLTLLEDRTVLSPLLVTTAADEVNPNDGVLSLREAIAQANADASNGQSDTIRFAGSLGRATITLTLGQLELSGVPPSGKSATETIDGAGLITVSGNDATRVFEVDAGVTAVFEGLTITHGKADGNAPGIPSTGGGILNFGELTLSHVVVSDNQAIGDINANPLSRGPGGAFGGGVCNGFTIDPAGTVHLGTLTVEDHSIFTRNQALGKGPDSPTDTKTRFPGIGGGGGLDNEGNATVTDSQFTNNLGQGGNNWRKGPQFAGIGAGGAIASVGISVHAQLVVSRSSFSDNQAVGGNDNSSGRLPGYGIGGAIFSHRFGNGADLNVGDSTFDHNQAVGGNDNLSADPVFGPNNATGGGIFIDGTINVLVTISHSTFDHNQAIGGQGHDNNGGLAHGGGIGIGFAGTIVTVSHCTVEHNQAIGGQAGPAGTGGNGLGGGISNDQGAALTVKDNSIIDHNLALGSNADTSGPASNGGSALGGGLYNDGTSMVSVTASSITHNHAIGAAGSNGGNGGDGLGGGFYNAGTATVTASSTTHNHAIGGAGGSNGGNGGDGLGGGLYNAGTANLIHSIIAFNHAASGEAGFGGMDGTGDGGGIFNAGALSIDALTVIFGNHPNDVAS